MGFVCGPLTVLVCGENVEMQMFCQACSAHTVPVGRDVPDVRACDDCWNAWRSRVLSTSIGTSADAATLRLPVSALDIEIGQACLSVAIHDPVASRVAASAPLSLLNPYPFSNALPTLRPTASPSVVFDTSQAWLRSTKPCQCYADLLSEFALSVPASIGSAAAGGSGDDSLGKQWAPWQRFHSVEFTLGVSRVVRVDLFLPRVGVVFFTVKLMLGAENFYGASIGLVQSQTEYDTMWLVQ
jgi:hypothetical protein